MQDQQEKASAMPTNEMQVPYQTDAEAAATTRRARAIRDSVEGLLPLLPFCPHCGRGQIEKGRRVHVGFCPLTGPIFLLLN